MKNENFFLARDLRKASLCVSRCIPSHPTPPPPSLEKAEHASGTCERYYVCIIKCFTGLCSRCTWVYSSVRWILFLKNIEQPFSIIYVQTCPGPYTETALLFKPVVLSFVFYFANRIILITDIIIK